MGFDGQAFFQKYLEGKTKQRTDNKERAMAERDRLEKSRTQLISLAKKKDELKGAARTTVSRLESYGATPDMIKAAVAEGPTGLSDLETALSKVVANKGLEFTKANVDAIAGITLDAKLTNVSVDALIDQTYGGAVDYKLGDYEGAQDLNWWQKLSGEGAMASMRKELDKTAVYDGKSLFDLDDYANSAAYNQVGGQSFLTYNQPKFFGVGNVGNARIEIQTVLGDNNALNSNLAQAKDLRDQIELTESNLKATTDESQRKDSRKVLAKLKLELDENLVQRRGILDREIKPFLDTQVAGYYEDTYMDLMGTTIDGYVGLPGYHDSFRSGVVESGVPDTITSITSTTQELKPNAITLLDNSLEVKDNDGNFIERNSDTTLKPLDESKGLFMFKAANGDVHIYSRENDEIYSVANTKEYLSIPNIPTNIIDAVNKFSGKELSIDKPEVIAMKKAMSEITYAKWLALIEKMNKAKGKNAKAVKTKITKELKEKGLPLTMQEMEVIGGIDLFKSATEVVIDQEPFVPRKKNRRGSK